jgi:DNA repair protein RadC
MLPREKYLEKGIDNLTDMDLIAILVGSGVKGKGFLSVSRGVISRMRRIVKGGREIDITDITEVEGVGVVTAMRILCGIELGKRLYGLESNERSLVRNSEEAYTVLRDIGSRK